MKVIHKKTNNIYTVFGETIINATNAQDGQTMILYQNSEGKRFVRETKEFWEKFKIHDFQLMAVLEKSEGE